jgi:hypothetical protein
MTVRIHYDEANRMVRAAYAGPCGMEDYLKATMGILEKFREHGTEKCLLDLRELDNRANLGGIFDLPRVYFEQDVPGNAKIGILAIPGHKDELAIRFYETVCINRGWRAQIFHEEEKLLGWLKSP